MKPVALGIFVVWMTWFLMNPGGFSHAYMDEGDVPEPDPAYGQSLPGNKNRKKPLQRRIRKRPLEVRQSSPTSSAAMILRGEQMIIEGEALKKKGELLMHHGQEWVEKGNKKRENSKWMQRQIERSKGGIGKK